MQLKNINKGYSEFLYEIETLIFQKKNNLSEEYDKYFKEDENNKSIYDKGFKKHLMPIRNKKHIKSIIQKTIKLKQKLSPYNDDLEISLLDFGCGNGIIYTECLKDLCKKYKNVKFKITAFDISKEGLKSYINKLKKDNFKIDGEIIIGKDTKIYDIGLLHKDNCSIKLVHGFITDNLPALKNILGQFDISLAIYGVLNHIPCEINRKKVFEFLCEISNHKVLIHVSTLGSYKKEQICFEVLRKNKIPFQMAVEENDIYYSRITDNSTIVNYYHLVDIKELNKLKNLKINKKFKMLLGCYYPHRQISSGLIMNILDRIMCILLSLFPLKISQHLVKYLFLEINTEK